MHKLLAYRKEIDEIDQKILELLNKRMVISCAIADFKYQNNLAIPAKKRESMILAQSKNYPFTAQLKQVYFTILHESNQLQRHICYLVGKRLSYSFSKEIHESFGNHTYQLKEITNLKHFVTESAFQAINVTNPFKKSAFELTDFPSAAATKTGMVNLLRRQDNQYYGDNTDYAGFLSLLEHYRISLPGKKVIIIGNGSTAKTVHCAAMDAGATSVVHLVRTVRAENEYLFCEKERFIDTNIIINATSYGVHPQLETETLFPLHDFHHLEYLIEVNYNPFRSMLALSRPDVPYISGLWMLIEQARIAEEIIQQSPISSQKSAILAKEITHNRLNIVFIGMPYAGKTTIGKALAEYKQMHFCDIDWELTMADHDLPTLLQRGDTLATFRDYESSLIKHISTTFHTVIATGGGAIERAENLLLLKQNGIVVWLNCPLHVLSQRMDATRPLASTMADLAALYQRRRLLYQQYADITIDAAQSIENIITEIEGKINAFIHY